MSRSLVALTILALGLFFSGRHAAFASGLHAPALSPAFAVAYGGDDDESKDSHDKPQVREKDGGSIDGEVVSVDYRTNHVSVRSGNTVYDVTVLPSTDFRGRSNSFHGITDLKRGAHVNVMLSQRAGMLTAQIIHLQ